MKNYQLPNAAALVLGLSVSISTLLCATNALAQVKEATANAANTATTADKSKAVSTVNDRALPAESAVNSTGQVTIKGKVVPYKVTAGTQPVWDKEGKVIASLFYTYYQRSDVANKDKRPLVISFNGGPGSASVWMHIAYTGPKMLNIDDEGYPIQPYGVRDNPHSILDVADIVYIDPVNTGFSRVLDPKADRNLFFGVNADITYLAEWLNTFVSRSSRWNSPKYLIRRKLWHSAGFWFGERVAKQPLDVFERRNFGIANRLGY